MRCPACRQSLLESVPACPHCGFDLAATIRVLGAAPVLEFPLSDFAGALSPAKKNSVTAALLEMTQTFPQLRFAVVICKVDVQIPLAAHAFWLFNTGGLTSPHESGSLCKLVLLELDVSNSRAACMIGYGLEPFVPQDAMDRIADAAIPGLQKGDSAAAIIGAIEMTRVELATVCQSITQAFSQVNAGQTAAAGSEDTAFAY